MVTRTKRLGLPAPRKPAGAPAPAPAPAPAAKPGDVEDLAAIAGEIDRERAAGAQQQQEQQKQTDKVENANANAARAQLAAELVAYVRPARDGADQLMAEFNRLPAGTIQHIWSDKTLEGIALPLLAVGDRHSEAFEKIMAQYLPYIALIGAVAMPCIATARAMRAYQAINVAARTVVQEGPQGGQQQPS